MSETPSEHLIHADSRFVWHPFTPMRQWADDTDKQARLIVAGEGFELIDSDGRRYIDGFSSLWCNLHGHRVKQIDLAITEQLGKIAHSTLLGYASPPSIELAEKLVKITPDGLAKVFYSDSGATAVEVALKMAFQYWKNNHQPERRKFIALKNSYHGDTIGSVSVGGMDTFHDIFRPLLFETTFVDTPSSYRHPDGPRAGEEVLRQIETLLESNAGEYCAVIVEPLVQGAAGMLTHPDGFLRQVSQLTQKYDTLLITDEVATGFCRTGKLFACQHEDVSPDLMCLGKGLTGGYLPVAATMATRRIFDAFLGQPEENKTFFHGHTYTGNALGCAAANASIDLIFSSGMLDELPQKAEKIRGCLDGLIDHPHVGDIRQCGMMAGVELVLDREKKKSFPTELRVGEAICKLARKRGVIIRPLGDVIVLTPAPAMDCDTLEKLLDVTVETICEFFESDQVKK